MKSIVKYRFKKIVPTQIWNAISRLVRHRKDNSFSETRKEFGKKNKNIEIFVIRRKPPGGGLVSLKTMVSYHRKFRKTFHFRVETVIHQLMIGMLNRIPI